MKNNINKTWKYVKNTISSRLFEVFSVFIASIAAAISAFLAHNASSAAIEQNNITQIHNKLSVQPRLSIIMEATNAPGIYIENNGLGPAVLKSISLGSNKNQIKSESEIRDILNDQNIDSMCFSFSVPSSNVPIKIGEKLPIIKISSAFDDFKTKTKDRYELASSMFNQSVFSLEKSISLNIINEEMRQSAIRGQKNYIQELKDIAEYNVRYVSCLIESLKFLSNNKNSIHINYESLYRESFLEDADPLPEVEANKIIENLYQEIEKNKITAN